MENKRERSSNFTRSECECLVSLIETYKGIIECKKTDVTTWKEKEATWSRMADDFNAVNDSHRTAKVLRAKYDNLKKLAKKDDARSKTEAVRTGGGPPVYTKPDELLERVKALICMSTSSLPPRYDSDRRYECRIEGAVEVECEVPVSEDAVILDIPSHNTSSSTTMWEGWSPSILRTPKHPALCIPPVADGGDTVEEEEAVQSPGSPSEQSAGPSHVFSTPEQQHMGNRKRPRTVYASNETRGLYNQLAVDKKQVVVVQKELLELEKLKINEERQFIREQHNKRMKQMDEEQEFKRELQEFAREEHKKRMLLLDLEIARHS